MTERLLSALLAGGVFALSGTSHVLGSYLLPQTG